ncbi:hypothetical protein KY285_026713 [Solanum tuberosum]|nr:hypothetical protein KY285_026713 [Solanum tuberosum]
MEFKEVNAYTHFCPRLNVDTTKFNEVHDEEITVDAAIESLNNNINLIAKGGNLSRKQEEIGALGFYGKCFWIELAFTIIAATTQNLTIEIQQQAWDEGFLLTVVYVSCQVGITKKLWESLRNHVDHHPIPWMVEGDFNVSVALPIIGEWED